MVSARYSQVLPTFTGGGQTIGRSATEYRGHLLWEPWMPIFLEVRWCCSTPSNFSMTKPKLGRMNIVVVNVGPGALL